MVQKNTFHGIFKHALSLSHPAPHFPSHPLPTCSFWTVCTCRPGAPSSPSWITVRVCLLPARTPSAGLSPGSPLGPAQGLQLPGGCSSPVVREPPFRSPLGALPSWVSACPVEEGLQPRLLWFVGELSLPFLEAFRIFFLDV